MVRHTGQWSSSALAPFAQGIFRLIIIEYDGTETVPIELFESVPQYGMSNFEVWRGDLVSHHSQDGGKISINLVSKTGFSVILTD